MEICYDLNAVPLYSSLIFRKLPEAFLRRLSLDMSHQFYLPGDIVYKHNHNKTIMVTYNNKLYLSTCTYAYIKYGRFCTISD